MIKRIWSILTGGRLVWLKDIDGEVTLAIARQSPFGGMFAERRWPFKIRTVELLDGGLIGGDSYVEQWVYAYPKEPTT